MAEAGPGTPGRESTGQGLETGGDHAQLKAATSPESPPPGGFRRLLTDFRKHPEQKTAKTAALSLPPDMEEDGAQETVVPEHGIKPGMEETWFQSNEYGFRLGVQKDSVPLSPSDETTGPIKVSPLESSMEFEGGQWEGVLKVDCFPSGRRFDAPLLFDFPVEAGNKEDPIIDSYGRIRYEVLIKEDGSNRWVRDREGLMPLQIVKDGQGKTYVRARIRHFCRWGCWKRKKLDFGPQLFSQTKIPREQRNRHQSNIKNVTECDIDIHIYAMRLSQWKVALKSVQLGGGMDAVTANISADVDARQEHTAFSKLPQMAKIPATKSHWLEIQRVGAGVWSSRKSAVIIATNEDTDGNGRKLRMEAFVHLRANMMLEVNLPVKDGKLSGSPAAAETGGILAQAFRVMQNMVNSERGRQRPLVAPPTVSRSPSEATAAIIDNSRSASYASAATGGSGPGQHAAGVQLLDSPGMAASVGDVGSPSATVSDGGTATGASGEPGPAPVDGEPGPAPADDDAGPASADGEQGASADGEPGATLADGTSRATPPEGEPGANAVGAPAA